MTTYPGAILKLIPPGSNDPRIQPVGVVLHVAVSKSDSLYGYFDGPSGGIESHLYVRFDGKVEQYRDFEHEADAQNAGNSWLSAAHRNGFISIETEGMGPGTWTAAQMKTLAEVIKWLSGKYGFPIRMVPKAQPASPATGGVGYHSLFPSWNPNGHNCPGPNRIKQIPDILAAAKGEDQVTKDDIAAIAAAVKDEILGAGLRDQVRQALDAELGDESGTGAFSDRVAAKVAAKITTATIDPAALANAVADNLALRLKS